MANEKESTNPNDEEFYKKYEAHQREKEVEYNKVSGHMTTEQEVREALKHFSYLRQELRDEELAVLQEEANDHLNRLKEIQFSKINEEIRCFKDILNLHKALVKNDKL